MSAEIAKHSVLVDLKVPAFRILLSVEPVHNSLRARISLVVSAEVKCAHVLSFSSYVLYTEAIGMAAVDYILCRCSSAFCKRAL